TVERHVYRLLCVSARRGRRGCAAASGRERGDTDLVQVAPILGLDLALPGRIAEEDRADRFLDHRGTGFDAAVGAEDLEPGRSVRDGECVMRLDECPVEVAHGGHE